MYGKDEGIQTSSTVGEISARRWAGGRVEMGMDEEEEEEEDFTIAVDGMDWLAGALVEK